MYRKQKESPYCAEFLADWKLNTASDTVLELALEEEQYTLQVFIIDQQAKNPEEAQLWKAALLHEINVAKWRAGTGTFTDEVLLKTLPGNAVCADCDSSEVVAVSLSHAITLCAACSK